MSPVASTHASLAWTRRNLSNGGTCTIRLRGSISLEGRLGNASLTCFHVKQAARSRRVSRAVFILCWFCGITDKPYPAWFWGPNQETVVVILMPKSLNRRCQFWGPNQETLYHRFWGQIGRNHPSGFEAKPLTNRQPWFWGSIKKSALLVTSCTVQITHNVTIPPDHLAIEYVTYVTIPDPLHQVSYYCHNSRRCPLCRTYHMHTMR
jgi:hypothetical protein